MRKAVITGPTGVIGNALIEQCLRQSVQVAAVCRKGSLRAAELPSSDLLRVVFCDLSELARLPDLLGEKDWDTFFHLGWDGTFGGSREDMEGQIGNIRYTVDAVHAAKALGCRRFVGAGSQAEYGPKKEKLRPDTPAFPVTGYGMAKLCAGQMSRKVCGQLGMIHVWPRILSVYGPHDRRDTMIMSAIRKLLCQEEVALTKGEQIWDYLYAADAGRALYLLGEKGIHGKVYPLGSGEARPLAEYVKQLRDSIDPDREIGFGKIDYAPGQVMYLSADLSELTKDTGFVPDFPFEEGIRRTIGWCLKNMQEGVS